MFYTVSHFTRFQYSSPVNASVMETRMHPRSDGTQRCLMFQLSVSPRCRVFSYRDHLGNHIHHFDVPNSHEQLVLVAESRVDLQPTPVLPSFLSLGAWEELDTSVAAGDFWEMLLPSKFAQPTALLKKFAEEINAVRRDDPLSVVHDLNRALYDRFSYVPRSTNVDSPIDIALETRQGVCQDFAHILIALLRNLGIPARYVSGYLYHRLGDPDRSVDGATHAWVEAFLPQLGWIGIDPTNCLLAGDRHIRTAIGRDYADVPPTKGIFQGVAGTELSVAVRVTPSTELPLLDQALPIPEEWSMLVEKAQEPLPVSDALLLQMQQQQQQQ